ncbi:holo-ACP synthase [Candidatus Pacearchaeota archaeon]|nr:holo-ACP synthase [Candidatus Pacearchaeota archaeon]
MEFEIGCDIQEIDKIILDKHFLSNIFTKDEISFCENKSNPRMHFAGRFAAKESAIKALSGLGEKIFYKDLEISEKQRKPAMKILKNLNNRYSIKVTISHSGNYAIGFTIVLKDEKHNN